MNHSELSGLFVRTELERKLKADGGGQLRDELVTRLTDYVADLEVQKRSGLPPQQYFQVDRLLSGARVAQQVVGRTWNSLHAA